MSFWKCSWKRTRVESVEFDLRDEGDTECDNDGDHRHVDSNQKAENPASQVGLLDVLQEVATMLKTQLQ